MTCFYHIAEKLKEEYKEKLKISGDDKLRKYRIKLVESKEIDKDLKKVL